MSEENENILGEEFRQKFRRLYELRQERDEAKTAATNAEKAYRVYEAELWDEVEESPFTGSFKLDLGAPYGEVGFQAKETMYGRLLDKEAARKFFERTGQLEAVTDSDFEMARIHEIVREHLDNKTPLPPGVDWKPKRYISISNQKD